MTTSQAQIVQKEIPLYAKTLIFIQTLIIIFFGYWFYNEYTYNTYFQAWVNGFIATNQLLLLTVFSGLVFIGVITGVHVRSRSTKTSLEATSESSNSSGISRSGKLDPGTEQHLINMIRRNQSSSTGEAQAQTSPTTSTTTSPTTGPGMPTLQRVDPNKPNKP